MIKDLVLRESNAVEVIIDTLSQAAFISIAGYCKLSGKSQATVARRCKKLALTTIDAGRINGSKPISEGGTEITLIPSHVVLEWAIKDCPGLAVDIGILGASVYLHRLAGSKVTIHYKNNLARESLSR